MGKGDFGEVSGTSIPYWLSQRLGRSERKLDAEQ